MADAVTAIGEGRFAMARGMTGGVPELNQTLQAFGDMAGLHARREQELKTSESRYRMLADNTNDIIFLHDPNGTRSYVSPACVRVLGYEPEELLALPAPDFVHPDDFPEVARKYAALSPEHPD